MEIFKQVTRILKSSENDKFNTIKSHVKKENKWALCMQYG